MAIHQKPSLTWSSAAKIAWRELQASRAKFLFVILSVAIGVAALTGVRGFSDSFQKTLLGEARTIMAADLSARMFRQPTPQEEQQLNELASHGMRRTEVSDTVSMVSSPGDPVPPAGFAQSGRSATVSVLRHGRAQPRGRFAPGADRCHRGGGGRPAHYGCVPQVGANLKIGDSTFRIAAILVREPDRMSSGMGLGPRVMMTQSALEKSGLLQQGSRSGERFFVQAVAGRRKHHHRPRPAWSRFYPTRRSPTFGKAIPR